MKDQKRMKQIMRAVWFLYLTEAQQERFLDRSERLLSPEENRAIGMNMIADFRALAGEIATNDGYWSI
jgi:hypothetical protein